MPAGLLGAWIAPHRVSAANINAGCWLTGSKLDRYLSPTEEVQAFARGDEEIMLHSPDPEFDRALALTLSRISEVFGVLPGFAYYDDHRAPNAYASPVNRLDRSDGTVLFGRNYLKQHLSLPEFPEVAVASVCAHEFGHIVQYKRNLMPILEVHGHVKRLELHADYLAGYFAGVRKQERPAFSAATVALTQSSAGDPFLSDPEHHGTQEERGAAVVKGFEGAVNGLSFDDAVSAGMTYVSNIEVEQ